MNGKKIISVRLWHQSRVADDAFNKPTGYTMTCTAHVPTTEEEPRLVAFTTAKEF